MHRLPASRHVGLLLLCQYKVRSIFPRDLKLILRISLLEGRCVGLEWPSNPDEVLYVFIDVPLAGGQVPV